MKTKLLVILMMISSMCFGQWTNDYNVNTLVSNSITGDVKTIGTNDGKTYVIYAETLGEPNNFLMKVQLLDANGNKMFGENGLVLNSIAEMASYTLMRDEAVDSEGNLYVAFTASWSELGYLHKISPTGEKLFGENGIVFGEYGYGPKLAVTNDGGVIVGWENKFMKYSPTGTPAWSTPKEITPPGEIPFIFAGDIALLSDGSFVIIYHLSESFTTIESNLWAQRYSADGVPMWANSIQLSQQTTHLNSTYSLAVDENNVIYYGFYGSTGFRFDSFLQRINPDGTTPWGIDGAPFSTDDSYYEFQTSIAYEQGSPYIWASAIVSNELQTENGQYVQKFNKETGEALLTDFAKPVFSVSPDSWINVSEIQLVNGHPFMLFSTGIVDGVTPVQLGVVLLKNNGDFVWNDKYRLISTTLSDKGNFAFTKNAGNQSVAIWNEDRGSGEKAYAQNFIIDQTDLAVDNIVSPSAISVYPNPVKDMLNIKSQSDIASVRLFDASGKQVFYESILTNNQVNVSSLSAGVYVAKIQLKDGTAKTLKIVKK